ncbi:MAG: CpaF family protein, partial [Lachnospiraceae bacterium]|nr:CpaF family protein [Lachnospiraceae bacterium]
DVLQDLMEDGTITEIMVNGPDHIFYEREGQLYQSERRFYDRKRLEDVIQKIASGVNWVINEANPIVDARLPDGSRVNAVLPPVSLSDAVLTIRKFPEERITMQQLIAMGSITQEAAEYLKVLVRVGYNIFVSGGTGVGKTTFLNVLSDYIPPNERIITIEDSAELQIKNIPNLVRLEVRNANMEGNHAVTIRDLIKTSLRMRPNRIIVGEVRDAASIDMVQSLNTGHCGMSTGHANSPADMLSRLETMVLLGEEIPLLAIRKQIASAIDIIIHLARLRDKTRRVTEIVEVLSCTDGEIPLNPLFRFEEEGEDENGRILGRLRYLNNPLQSRGKLLAAGEEECIPHISE